MTRESRRSSVKPVVFVFPLSEMGEWLKKKVPAQYVGCPGYWFRSAHEAHFEKLGAIAEPELSEQEADEILGWVDEYIDACDVRASIYTDDEHAEVDEPDEDDCGFHPGVTLERGIRALEAGGFRVVRAPFPQTLANEVGQGGERYATQLDALVARVQHHLDYASILRALSSLDDCDQLSIHLRQVVSLLDGFLGSEQDDALTARLAAAAPGWSGAHRDKLHLVLAEVAKESRIRSQALNPNIVRLRAALPPPSDSKVKEALAKA